MLLQQVENILEKSGFDYCEYSGCFDLAARRNFTLFLKVLGNVDSLHENQARNLKIISKNFDATVAVIGNHTRTETLHNNVIYERFEIPTFTPSTLENIVVNDMFPFIYRFRGGLFAEIDPAKLRANREKAGMTQEQLAESVGTSKKSIYEHEHEKKKALLETAEKIGQIIGNVTEPVSVKTDFSGMKSMPSEGFEKLVSRDFKKIGLSSDSVQKAPFNLIAHDQNVIILSRADENRNKAEKNAPKIAQISSIMKKPALAVTKDEIDLDIPTIQEKELREIRHAKELKKRLK